MWQKLVQKLIQKLIKDSWWVWLTFVIAFGMYEQGAYHLSRKIHELEFQIARTTTKLEVAKAHQEELKAHVASFNDPQWIELVLIQNLGLVPEGYTKVYFQNEEK